MAPTPDPAQPPIVRLLQLMATLRTPGEGCPWDLEQSFATIAPHTIEEAYEVADAIDRGDLDHLKEECGDLLFQIVFYARMAEESGAWTFDDVAHGLVEKDDRPPPPCLRRSAGRHRGRDARPMGGDQGRRTGREGGGGRPGGERARRRRPRPAGPDPGAEAAAPGGRGSDSTGPRPARSWTRSREEIAELREAIAEGQGAERRADELGDLLFALVNLARRLGHRPRRRAAAHQCQVRSGAFAGSRTWLALDGLTPDQVDPRPDGGASGSVPKAEERA